MEEKRVLNTLAAHRLCLGLPFHELSHCQPFSECIINVEFVFEAD